jgi:hypothetical protein
MKYSEYRDDHNIFIYYSLYDEEKTNRGWVIMNFIKPLYFIIFCILFFYYIKTLCNEIKYIIMIIIYNFITLCKYIINKVFGLKNIDYIEFEYTDNDDIEEPCYCNLCYTVRNIMLFTTQRLKEIKLN